MTLTRRIAVACTATALAAASAAHAQPGASASDWEGLVRIKSQRLEAVYLLPGADYRGYTKIMLDRAQVAFNQRWLLDMNQPPVDLSRRVSAEDAREIAAETGKGLDQVFAAAFDRAGYQIVTAPAADVLRLTPRIVNLYINAPGPLTTGAPGVRSYTVNAGEATLALEARDSTSGHLLGRVVDTETARDYGRAGARRASPSSNRADFEAVFDNWAKICVAGLAELKQASPLAPPK